MQRQEKLRQSKVCEICGSIFNSRAWNAKICEYCKPEHARRKAREWLSKNRERAAEIKAKSYRKGVDSGRVARYESKEEVRDRRRRKAREYYWKNRDEILSSRSSDKGRSYSRDRMRSKMKEPSFRLSSNVSRGIRASISDGKKGRKWESVVGYGINDLAKHLERQFLRGMTWENYGEWHVDHIRPISSFEFESCDDQGFVDCWSLSNLRPLWAKENISKGCKTLFLI